MPLNGSITIDESAESAARMYLAYLEQLGQLFLLPLRERKDGEPWRRKPTGHLVHYHYETRLSGCGRTRMASGQRQDAHPGLR